jgi:hypothetical protein
LTVLDDYLREVRPLLAPPPRTFQRTLYRPGEICPFDLWEPSRPIPVGAGQERPGWVVVACLGYSRAGDASSLRVKCEHAFLAMIGRQCRGPVPQGGRGRPDGRALREVELKVKIRRI